MSFAPFPSARMPATLLLEAFGQISPRTDLSDEVSGAQDLYSVFMTRAELMSWSTHASSSSSPRFAEVWERGLLWGMNEAELTAEAGSSRIGWVQVGLEVGVEAAMALPALIQCFDDALRRFGVVELSGLQVTAGFLPRARPCAGNLVSGLNWFQVAHGPKANAVIAVDDGLLQEGTESELVARLQQLYTGPFKFESLVAVPEQHSIEVPPEQPDTSTLSPAQWGLSVTLPEWTASAAAWVLAVAIDELRFAKPDVSHFAARIARVG